MHRIACIALAAGSLTALACRGPETRVSRQPGHGIVLLETTEAGRSSAGLLEAAGVREFWIPAASLEGDLWKPAAWPQLPAGSAVVFVLGGVLPAQGESRVPEAATLVRQRRLDAVSRGWVPAGIHFEGNGSPEAVRALLSGIRRELGEAVWLSVGGAAAATPHLDSLAELVVVDAFGQSPQEDLVADRWDLTAARQRVTQAVAGGIPVLVRIAIGAVLEHQSGANLVRTTRFEVGPLARSRGLRLREGFDLSGGERLTYEWSVLEGGRRGPFLARPRDLLRYRAPRPSAVRELAAWCGQQQGVAGILFDRWPEPAERGGMGLETLAQVLRAGAAAPALQIEIVPVSQRGRSMVLRLRLTNPSAWATDLATLGANYVELEGEGGFFGEVEPGDFSRYEFLRHGEEKVSVQAMRSPQRLRLYAPLVGAGERLESGQIELRSASAVRAKAEFRLPGGEALRAQPVRWPA